MAMFRFRLQAVLDEREREETRMQAALAEVQSGALAIEGLIEQCGIEVQREQAALRDGGLVGAIDVSRIIVYRRFVAAKMAHAQMLSRDLVEARLAVEAARKRLAEAARNRKAIETLRDQQKARWLQDQDRRDVALSDEIGIQNAFDDLSIASASPDEPR
jgi:flagellar export protein FliJ